MHGGRIIINHFVTLINEQASGAPARPTDVSSTSEKVPPAQVSVRPHPWHIGALEYNIQIMWSSYIKTKIKLKLCSRRYILTNYYSIAYKIILKVHAIIIENCCLVLSKYHYVLLELELHLNSLNWTVMGHNQDCQFYDISFHLSTDPFQSLLSSGICSY